MRTYPRQKLYDVGHGQFFAAWSGGKLNDGNDGDFTSAFARFMETDRGVVPLSRGRLGVYFAVKAAVKEGRRKVLLSPFTIFDLINMVIVAGGEPVFLDSAPDSPHIPLAHVNAALGDDVAALIITHYHTSNPEIAKIAAAASKAGVMLIEDCAISMGGRPGGKPVGLHGDVGVFSFGLFKFIATYFGGAMVVKDPALAASVREQMAGWPQMTGADLKSYLVKGLKLDTLTQPLIFSLLTFPAFRWGYLNDIAWVKKQAVNDPEPVLRSELPDMFKRRPSDFQQREWARQLPKVLENRERRLANARAYRAALEGSNAIVIPPAPDDVADCFLNFPVLVDDRDAVLKGLMARGFDASQYYYRNCAELEVFKAFHRDLPNIGAFVNRLLVLPAYPSVPEEYAKALAAALREIAADGPAAHEGASA
ncbi:MAG: DegT/DnrJ/EryC1/StrS aminotransferase family protein [Oceanicaulis sp.]|nr:DegT/DnrJ/EryC1/StrS aminotransferase family protein [Oceanicaulis sp.]